MQCLTKTGLAVVIAIFGVTNAMAIEEAKYTAIVDEKIFEVRRYEPHILAETLVDGDFNSAGNEAFGRLFNYISGNNTTSKKVAMTAPVSMQGAGEKISMTSPVGQEQKNARWAVSFMMPSSFVLATLPTPKDTNVALRQIPERYVASIRYSGFWSRKRYLVYEGKLKAWVDKKSYSVVGEPIWARYDAPYVPWFLRRNEILLPIEKPLSSD